MRNLASFQAHISRNRAVSCSLDGHILPFYMVGNSPCLNKDTPKSGPDISDACEAARIEHIRSTSTCPSQVLHIIVPSLTCANVLVAVIGDTPCEHQSRITTYFG